MSNSEVIINVCVIELPCYALKRYMAFINSLLW